MKLNDNLIGQELPLGRVTSLWLSLCNISQLGKFAVDLEYLEDGVKKYKRVFHGNVDPNEGIVSEGHNLTRFLGADSSRLADLEAKLHIATKALELIATEVTHDELVSGFDQAAAVRALKEIGLAK